MPINPFWDPFGGTAAAGVGAGATGAGAGIAGAGASAAAGGGIPWSIIIPMAISAITSLLGGQSQEKKQQEALEQVMAFLQPELRRYTSGIQRIDPIIQKALTSRLDQTQGWGWPTPTPTPTPGIGG